MQIEMKNNTGCLNVSFDNSYGDTGDNGDKYFFTITNVGGQSFTVDGEEKDKIILGIVGNMELHDFLSAMDIIRRLRDAD